MSPPSPQRYAAALRAVNRLSGMLIAAGVSPTLVDEALREVGFSHPPTMSLAEHLARELHPTRRGHDPRDVLFGLDNPAAPVVDE